jgi:hypothetical protein
MVVGRAVRRHDRRRRSLRGDDVLPGASTVDLETAIADLRRQARRQAPELTALLERLDELPDQVTDTSSTWTAEELPAEPGVYGQPIPTLGSAQLADAHQAAAPQSCSRRSRPSASASTAT